jgi:hypothetical protein
LTLDRVHYIITSTKYCIWSLVACRVAVRVAVRGVTQHLKILYLPYYSIVWSLVACRSRLSVSHLLDVEHAYLAKSDANNMTTYIRTVLISNAAAHDATTQRVKINKQKEPRKIQSTLNQDERRKIAVVNKILFGRSMCLVSLISDRRF